MAFALAKYLLIDSKGVEKPLDLDDLGSHKAIKGELRTFIETEELGRAAKGEPPHIRIMRQLELIALQKLRQSLSIEEFELLTG